MHTFNVMLMKFVSTSRLTIQAAVKHDSILDQSRTVQQVDYDRLRMIFHT